MYLFLQDRRATIIPTIVVPIALLGSCIGHWMLGFSINVLTLFGMVLAIGILVDDAIVVIENVERVMEEDKSTPYEVTIKAVRQIYKTGRKPGRKKRGQVVENLCVDESSKK